MDRGPTRTTCPKCGARLLYDGTGQSCIACAFKVRTPSTKVRRPPRRKDKSK